MVLQWISKQVAASLSCTAFSSWLKYVGKSETSENVADSINLMKILVENINLMKTIGTSVDIKASALLA